MNDPLPRQPHRRLAVRVPAALALLAVPVAAALLGWAAAGLADEVRARGRADVDVLLALVAAAGAALTLAVVTVTTALTLLAAVYRGTGRTPAHLPAVLAAWTPAVLRRLAEVALGIALVGGSAGVAAATAGAPATPPAAPTQVSAPGTSSPGPLAPTARGPAPETPPSVDRPAADGPATARSPDLTGWRPDRPATVRRVPPAPVRLVTSAARLEHARQHTVVVRRGDSLWRLVERYLGPTASAAEVAAEWPRWYAANRSVVGPDPDLLRPGQQLVPPAPR